MTDRRFGFAFNGGSINASRTALGLAPDCAVNYYGLEAAETAENQNRYLLRNAVKREPWPPAIYTNLAAFARAHAGMGLRYYCVNEPELGDMSVPIIDLASLWLRAKVVLTEADPTAVLMSPAFSHCAFGYSPVGAAPVFVAGVPYAEAWIREMVDWDQALPAEWTFHAYPRQDGSLSASDMVCQVVEVAERVHLLLGKYRQMYPAYIPPEVAMRYVLSEVGVVDCAVGGPADSGNWAMPVFFMGALADALKAGRLRVHDVCWFASRSGGDYCQTGQGSGGNGGYLIYSNRDPDGRPGSGVACQSWLANCPLSACGQAGSLTPLGECWREAAQWG